MLLAQGGVAFTIVLEYGIADLLAIARADTVEGHEENGPYAVRKSSPGLDRVATSAGTTAMRLAATRTPATRCNDEPDGHDGDRDRAQIVCERPPHGSADDHP